MKPDFADWLGRIGALALAGMVTLSLIGAIAAIPSGSFEGRMGLERIEHPAPVPPDQPRPERVELRPEQTQPNAMSGGRATPIAVSAAPERADVARWLEAITYALLALAGLMALAVLLLWRMLAAWRRVADALENRPL